MQKPEVLTFEQYAASKNAGRGQIGDAALHQSSERKSPKTHRRQVEAQAKKDRELIVFRAHLQNEYDKQVQAGLIRPPTTKEEVMWKALHGHPDNASVQAARRIAIRRGWIADIWTNTGK